MAVGIYLALTIPVAVFPETNFPRMVVGVDNGVLPIDQMLVTVTRPIEEAVNTVPGLDHVWSITSRGTAEIDLFFNWNVDMYRTLELVNAALARVQPTLPPTAKITANRLTFAAFPIMGYSLTSDTVPQTRSGRWPLTRSSRGSTAPPASRPWWCRAARCRNFRCEPDPAKLVQTGVTVPEYSGRHRPQQHDRFAGADRDQRISWCSSLVSGQTRTPAEIGNIVVKTTPAGAPVRIGDMATVRPR